MKKLVVSDTGPIISLAIIGKIDLLFQIFDEIIIAEAVYNELLRHNTLIDDKAISRILKNKIPIKSENYLSMLMDLGESESVILYKEKNADLLLIDDKKARSIAESMEVKCIGTIGLLRFARENGLVKNLRSIFETLINNNRYFSIKLLNEVLKKVGEKKLASNDGQ